MTQKVTSNSITSVDVSKLSGNHTNATDGRNLTNINDGIIESPNDPTASSNPTGGLGTLWVNYTSGEMYNLTNASTNSNYWKNVGGQTGDIFKPPYQFQGTQNGFHSGSDTAGLEKRVQKFAFSSNTNATIQCDLVHNVARPGTCDDAMNGYGYCFNGGHHSSTNTIDRFSHASTNTSNHVGGMVINLAQRNGLSSETHGYIAGAYGLGQRDIEKFQYAASVNSAQWSLLLYGSNEAAPHSNVTHGYLTMGWSTSPHAGGYYGNIIRKIVYASSGTQTSVGTLTSGQSNNGTGCNDTTHGYHACGTSQSFVARFQFANESNSSTLGNLNKACHGAGGQSSETYGHVSGGVTSNYTTIEKFQFSASLNKSGHGDLYNTTYQGWSGGNQQ